MRKEKSPTHVNAIILATTVAGLFTAVVNLWAATVKAAPTLPAPPVLQALCPASAAPQVIQYLGIPPAGPEPTHEKEPSRPGGQ